MKSVTYWYQFFTRCEELVPILHGVKFTKCEIYGSTRLIAIESREKQVTMLDRLGDAQADMIFR